MANFNINKVILGGRLTADVELKATPQGVSVCSFSIAVNRRASKEQEQKADFINCIAWRNTAEFISKYFKKGSSICISGSVQTRSWVDKNGQNRYATEIIADEAYFVDSKAETAPSDTPNNAPTFNAPTPPQFEEIQKDDDLPF